MAAAGKPDRHNFMLLSPLERQTGPERSPARHQTAMMRAIASAPFSTVESNTMSQNARYRSNRFTRFSFLLGLALALGACANTATKMLVDPEVVASKSGLGAGQTVQLQVSAQPGAVAAGDGHNRYDLEKPLTDTVRDKLAVGLMGHQFQVGSGTGERQFIVSIEKADHLISRAVLRDTITVETRITFTAMTPAGSRSRTFTDKREREVGGTATLGEVAGEVNQSVGHVLAKALNDAELMAFLGQ